MTFNTIDSVLLLDLKDYASLVFDVAPDEKSALYQVIGGVQVSISQVKLTGAEKKAPQKPEPIRQENIIQQLRLVMEGWSEKLTAANIGFGIVVALILVSLFAGCLLLGIN